jgi:hypothetical protein
VHPAGLKVELDKKAPLDSPALTGTPTAPTAAAGTNTTQLATTAFVRAATPTATASVAGVDVKLWKKTGTTLETETANDSVSLGGGLLVGTSSARSNVYVTTAKTTPPVQFDFNDNSYNAGVSLINYSGLGFAPTLTLGLSQNNTRGTNAGLSPNIDMGIINFVGNDGTDFQTGATIAAATDSTTGTGDMPGRLVFSTTADGASSPTERMRIDSTGGINSFSGAGDTFVARSSSAAGTTNFLFRGTNGATSTLNGTVSFQVSTNGNVQNTNNGYGAISDVKLKENIVDAGSQWDDLKALQVRNYNLKEETGYQTHTQIGLVAQEVELVSPGLVSESPDRDEDGSDLGTVTKSVNYSVLYMKAVKALQEAMQRIETLETRITTLEARP